MVAATTEKVESAPVVWRDTNSAPSASIEDPSRVNPAVVVIFRPSKEFTVKRPTLKV